MEGGCPPSSVAGRAGAVAGPRPLRHPEHPVAGRLFHPSLPCLDPSSGSFPRFPGNFVMLLLKTGNSSLSKG